MSRYCPKESTQVSYAALVTFFFVINRTVAVVLHFNCEIRFVKLKLVPCCVTRNNRHSHIFTEFQQCGIIYFFQLQIHFLERQWHAV